MQFPKWSLKRLVIVGLTLWVVSMVLYFLTPHTMPAWVAKWKIPLWFAHNWPLGIIPAWLALTFGLNKLGYLGPKPSEEEWQKALDRYPQAPHLSTRELWERDDAASGITKR